jgi:putative transposase
MGHTFTNHLYHVVFSTKGRLPLIDPGAREELFKYICGIARKQNGFVLRINGTADHVHILATLKASVSVSDFVRAIKANSSKWLSETFPSMQAFEWQAGYCSFSVSESVADAVKHYIDTQDQHHSTRTFAEELKALLDKHRIDYDPSHYLD